MGLQLFQRKKKTASLVFTDHSIRFMDVALGAQPKIIRWEEHPLSGDVIRDGKVTDPDAFRIILEGCAALWGIKRRDVQFLVPDQYVNVRIVPVQKDIREDELKGHIFLEIGTQIHLPFEDPAFDAKIIREGEKDNEVLLVASSGEVVEAYVRGLEEAKLKPAAAEISPLALYRLFHHAGMTDSAEHYLLLHFDQDLLTMSIFHEDIPLFMKPVAYGTDSLSSHPEESNDINPLLLLEDAFHEIDKVIEFYTYTLNKGDARIDRVLLSGDHERFAEIKAVLSERLPVKPEEFPPGEFATPDGRPLPPGFLPVLGLALKEVNA